MATVSSPEFKYHAFVSHSSQDNEFVRKLGDDLERAGAKIFDDDRCIKPAANIVHSIEEALHESRKLILVMSKAWERSEWTAAEFFPDLLEDPMNVDRRIIPILLDEECEPPRQIRVLKHIDFTNQEDYSIRLRELIEALDLVAPAYEMSNTASAPPALLDTVPIPSLSEISFGFASEVATLYKLLGFTVSSHLGNLRVHQNLGFRSEIEVLCEEGVLSEDRAGQILEEIQAGGNGKFGVVASRGFTQKAWQSLSGAGVECLTYSELLDQLLPLEGYIRSHIVDQWEGRVNDPDRGWGGRDLFIRPRVRDDFTNEESKALDRFSNWLGNDRDNFLIILGDLGTGKSTLCEFLAYQLAQAFLEDPSRHPAPVLIPLREARRAAFSLETIVATHFAVHGMPDARFANFFHLVRRRRIVLFFDAFDEMADRIRWNETRANFAELKRSVQPGTKVVMTCRTHYFKSREEQLETLNGGGLTFSDTATELYRAIHGDSGLSVLNQCEFNASEIETYMRKARPERWEKDIAKMEEIHNLSGLAHRPLLLDMIVKSLPRLDHNQEVTAADLYATYTSFWIQREEKKHPTLRPEHKLHLMMELAWHLWKEHRNEVQEDQLIAFVEKLDRVRIHEEEPRDIVREMHTATFLQRGSDGRSFRFVHRSFMEYFIARRLCDDCGLLHGSAPVVEINPAVFDLPRLDQKIVFFLAGLDKEDQLRSPLAAVLSAGYWERVSENALQILYWSCRIRLGMEKEISDIELLRGELLNRIPAHAQLDESKLDQMVLEGAVLRGANLRGANLTDTNLNRADLTGAKSMGAKRDGLLIDEAIGIEPGDAGFEGGAVPVCQLGHSTKVRAIAYDPEGKWMACGADDGSVAIREPDTGRIVWLFTHHHAPVRAVTFSPDGKYLASCGDDRSIKIQKMATGEMVHDIHGHAFSVLSIAFSPDGSLLVSGSGDRSIFLWDVRSGFQLLEFQGHTGAVNSVAFSSDGFFFASGSDDGSVRLWEVDTGKQRMQLEAHSAPVRSVAICPRNLLLATSSEDQGVKLWAIESGVELRKLNGHGNAVNSVAFSPSGDYLASASTDHDITLWEVESGFKIYDLRGHTRGVTSVCFRPDGAFLASSSEDRSIRVWDVEFGALRLEIKGHCHQVLALDFSPNGRRLIAARKDGELRFWDFDTNSQTLNLKVRATYMLSAKCSPNGVHVVSGTSDQLVKLWKPATGHRRNLKGHRDWVHAVDFSPDGSKIASGGGDKVVKIWDTVSLEQLAELKAHTDCIRSVSFHPDGEKLATGGDDRTIKIWDLESNELSQNISGHHWASVLSVACSPNGKHLASGSTDQTAKIWDIKTGRLLQDLNRHTHSVHQVNFSPDSEFLTTVSNDHTAKIWNVKTGELVHDLRGHSNSVRSAAFSPSGNILSTASDDGMIKFWDAKVGKEIATLVMPREGVWLVYLPDGRFNASPLGIEYLAFTLPNELKSLPARELRREFYDPEGVGAVLGRYFR